MMQTRSARGFTLAETVVAAGLLVTALAGLAQLLASSVRFTRDSGQSSIALVAAQDKVESLRALDFGYDAGGAAVTDERLLASPAGTLTHDVAGFVDWLDVSGEVLDAPAGAEYVRRWRITEVVTGDPAAMLVEVCVFHARTAAPDVNAAESCLSTARVRQP